MPIPSFLRHFSILSGTRIISCFRSQLNQFLSSFQVCFSAFLGQLFYLGNGGEALWGKGLGADVLGTVIFIFLQDGLADE